MKLAPCFRGARLRRQRCAPLLVSVRLRRQRSHSGTVIGDGLRDARGVVYLEFLFAFFPIFLLFLAVVQLSLAGSARVVVGQAANQAARSAMVVLEEDPEQYDGVPRGMLSEGDPNPDESLESLLEELELASNLPSPEREDPQQGARMEPIRTAGSVPLLSLAPSRGGWQKETSVGDGVRGGWADDFPFSIFYTRAASQITVHQGATSEQLAVEPVAPDALVRVRVEYLYQCSIPLVRNLLCDELSDLLDEPEEDLGETVRQVVRDVLPFQERETQPFQRLREEAPGGARFVRLIGEASLPNQGAKYYQESS